jgi:hypothetical protein
MKIYFSTITLGILLVSCVPKADHVELQREHENLQAQHKALQAEAADQKEDAAALKEALLTTKDALDKQKEEASRQIQEAKESAKGELESLKSEFQKFKTDRRTGMVGKKFPEIVLKNERVLTDAKITEVTASSLKVLHSGGITMVRFAELGPDLQWEAVWDEEEAAEHEAVLANKNKEDAQNMGTIRMAQSVELAVKQRTVAENRVRELEALIPNFLSRVDEQRSQLNSAFSKLKEQHTRAPDPFRRGSITRISRNLDDDWNSSEPENSQLLTNWQKRTQESSALDGLANAIRSTKKMGSAASAELAKLKAALANNQNLNVGN